MSAIIAYPQAPTDTPSVTISASDGSELLSIWRDGTVTGTVENASEAAAVFVRELRHLLGGTITRDRQTAIGEITCAWSNADNEYLSGQARVRGLRSKNARVAACDRRYR